MTAIVILNILFAAFVVLGIVAILSWGIARNRSMADALAARAHAYARARQHPARPATARQARTAPGRRYGYSA